MEKVNSCEIPTNNNLLVKGNSPSNAAGYVSVVMFLNEL